MGIFRKKETKKGGIISSDEDLKWHIENLDDKNKYVIVKSKLTDFSGAQFLKRVNTLIQSGYIPQGGTSSDSGYTYQSLFRSK